MTNEEYLQSAWRCISASGSSWASGAGPCTALLKRMPLWRLTKQKSGENKQSTQPVSATKTGQDDKTEAASSAADVFPHLRQKWFVWQGFLHIPVWLLNSGWMLITAQQFGWWLKGGEGKLRIKGKRWRSSRTSPAGPGTCPGQQLQLLLWRESQLSLAASNLPPVASPLAPAFIQKPSLSSVFSNSPSYSRSQLEN